MNPLKKIYDAAAVAAIVAVLVIFFYKFLFLGMIPLNADWLTANFNPWKSASPCDIKPYFNNDVDPVLYMYPIKHLTIELMKNGEMPLWNPYILCGVPLWGNNFSAPLNPLNIVFFLFDFMKAWGVFFMAQFAAAGIGMYFFCVQKGMGRIAACVAAIAYMLNTSFVIWFPTMSYLGVVAWLPLVFFMIDRMFTRKDSLSAFWCGASFALFFWSGLIQMAVYSAIFAFLYLICRYIQERSVRPRRVVNHIRLALIVIVVAVLFSLPELIVQKTNIVSSTRTPGRYGLSILYPQMLLSYISPNFFGTKYDGWDLGYGTYIFNRGFVRLSPPYIGILPLFFAIIGFFTRKDRDRFFYLLFSIGILASLMLIAFPFVYKPLLKMAPFLNSVDNYRLTALYVFSMSVMAGWGFNSVLLDKDGRKLIWRVTVITLLSIAAVFFGLELLSHADTEGLLKTFIASLEKKAPSAILEGSHSLRSIYKFMEYLNILKIRNGIFLLSPEVYMPALFVLISLVLIYFLLNLRNRILLNAAVFLFVSFDLLCCGINFPAYSHPSNIYPPTGASGFLAKDETLHRVAAYTEKMEWPYGDIFPPNTGMMYGMQDIRGYENLAQPRWIYRFMMGDNPDEIAVAKIGTYDNKFLPFLNVKYMMSDVPISIPDWNLVYDNEIRIYEDTKAMPRTFFAKKILFAKDGESVYRMIRDVSFDPIVEVVVEAEEGGASYLQGAGHDSAPEITYYGPNEVKIRNPEGNAGLLVLADTYFPGWRVFVDGKERKLFRANYAFRAVGLKKGDRTVRFVFRPTWFYEALYLCIGLFVVMLALTLWSALRKKA